MIAYFIPFISAFIGWFTNWIAIKMLFHPKEEKKILGLRIQGIFPKRQAQFAEKLGQLVARELISIKDISEKLNQPQTLQMAMPFIESHIDNFINVKLKEEIPLLAMFINEETMGGIRKGIITEIEELFPALLAQLTTRLEQEIQIEKIVIEKVKSFSSDKLEEILKAIMSKEFRFVEIIGAVLGFIIGLFQVLLTLFGS